MIFITTAKAEKTVHTVQCSAANNRCLSLAPTLCPPIVSKQRNRPDSCALRERKERERERECEVVVVVVVKRAQQQLRVCVAG